jgi:excisionase family DNA binding protein
MPVTEVLLFISCCDNVSHMPPNRRVPRRAGAVSDETAAELLNISRMTLFRKLASGIITAPNPVAGTKRRWWTLADVDLAREQLAEDISREKIA